ncbi:DUF2786 domain-containing protein [Streptomyces qinglanensis]|uniref:DUF2786 domain-containing protein n=1 Tax=Streptomyces qinglanensis TaxID=943816 RepID=UPI003D71BE5F
MTNWILPVASSGMLVFALISLCAASIQRDGRHMVGCIVAVTVAFLLRILGSEDLGDGLSHWLSDSVLGTSQPKPHPSGRSTSPSVPVAKLLLLVCCVLACVLLGFAAKTARKRLSRRRAERRDEQAARAEENARWAGLHADHDAVRDAYGAYRLDVLAFLDRPALDDASVPQTAAFLRALFEAEDARRGADLTAYRTAVVNLRVAWKAADAHARGVGTGIFGRSDRAAIAQARRLLIRARDAAGGPHEQHTAAVKACKLLAGVIDLPQEAVQALETRHRLSLTKPDPSSAS